MIRLLFPENLEKFFDFCKEEYPVFEVIVVNCSLRKGEIYAEFRGKYFNNKKFIFIDDSFYSGKTLSKIKEYLLSSNGELIATYVFYDGCKEKTKDLYSIYSYY